MYVRTYALRVCMRAATRGYVVCPTTFIFLFIFLQDALLK